MKMIIVALALVALAAAVPVEKEPIKILRSDLVQEPQGPYNFNFESENGIIREESGVLKEVLDEEKKPHTVVVVKGSYSYKTDDGKVDTITYFADETGYHALGDSIPKPVEPVSRR